MARIVGRRRLSRGTEESTSFERQQEIIESYARMHGDEIVGWADDMDVSGGIPPLEAPNLAPWFEPDRVGDWDKMVAWKLDRMGRTLFGLNDLFRWFTASGKTLVCVEDHIDLSHWTGRLVATVIAGVAEGELENTKVRTRASRAKLRELGRWHGGQVPFGYQASKDADGWTWELVPEEADVVREMAARAAAGESASSIAQWLDSTDHRPRRVGHWTFTGVNRILRSRWVLGQAVHDGRVVLDEDGLPLQFADPILTDREWQAAQAALDNLSVPKKRKNGTGLLLHIGRCSECGEWLYHFVKSVKGREYRYWRCSGKTKRRNQCSAPNIPAEQLEAFVEERFLSDLGDYERTEKVFIPATGHGDQLESIEAALKRIRAEADAGLYDGEDDEYMKRVSALSARRNELKATPAQPAHWEDRGVGETYREAWGRESRDGRRRMLVEHGILVRARAKPFEAHLYVPVDIVRKTVPGFQPPNEPGAVDSILRDTAYAVEEYEQHNLQVRAEAARRLESRDGTP